MASYKVSYKMLSQQGEEMKTVAKLIDGYAEQVNQVAGKLSEGDMMSEARTNLQKLREQLIESKVVLNTAGEFLTKSVDNYTGVELRQVKKVDGMRAHNRDFYKNPVVVASAGGAASGAVLGVGTASSSPAAASTLTASASTAETPGADISMTAVNYADHSVSHEQTIDTTINYSENYTDNSVNITNIVSDSSAPAARTAQSAAVAGAQFAASSSNNTSSDSTVMDTVITAGLGALGGVAVTGGAVAGSMHMKKKRDNDKEIENAESVNMSGDIPEDSYDPEVELEKALQKVRDLED